MPGSWSPNQKDHYAQCRWAPRAVPDPKAGTPRWDVLEFLAQAASPCCSENQIPTPPCTMPTSRRVPCVEVRGEGFSRSWRLRNGVSAQDQDDRLSSGSDRHGVPAVEDRDCGRPDSRPDRVALPCRFEFSSHFLLGRRQGARAHLSIAASMISSGRP
jgi:hypothetical protein